MQHQEVVLVEALRSPIGRLGGQLANVRPDDLLAEVVRQVVTRSGIDPKLIDQVYAGAANQAGEDNRNVARMATLLAGLPDSVPGVTVNRLCASGLEAVVQGYRQIALGEAQCVVAGGVESMSRAPYVLAKASKAFPVGGLEAQDTCLGWRFKNPKLEAIFPLEAMGCTAENLADDYQISRREQDEFALASQNKAIAAIDAGDFKREIVPIEVAYRKHTETVDTDEGPRRGSSLEALSGLRAVFRGGGSVTAGNASTLNDGASALMVCSRTFAEAHGLKVRATVRSVGSAGVDPTRMGIGPVPASQQALKRAGLSASDLDLIELNEAFAVQSLACIRELELDPARVNVRGGAIALGHPLGCSGARILTTLLHALEDRDQSLGLATLCVGVGQGLAMIIER
ncbi:MAG: thiolase family protein [Myxococcota bacterium]|nr:thiolase family protein [Myxococcota bacterium]